MGFAPGPQQSEQPRRSCGGAMQQVCSEPECQTLVGSQVMGRAVEGPGLMQLERCPEKDDPNLPSADESPSPSRLMLLFTL